MKKIIFIGNDMYGIVNLNIGLAQKLQKLGHEVNYYVGPTFQDHIEKHGLRYKKILYPQSPYPLHTCSACLSSLEATRYFLKKWSGVFREERPDCIITTHDGLPGTYLARLFNTPLFVTNPFDTNKLFWEKFWKDNSIESFRHLIDTATENNMYEDYATITKLLTKEYGLNFPKTLQECTYGGNIEPPGMKRINLILNSKYFLGSLAINTDNHYYIGTMTRDEAPQDIGLELNTLDKKPLVFISLGTIYCNNQGFLDTCCSALGDMDVDVVYSLARAKLDISKIPKNFIIKEFVPQLELLKRASLFITHGGMSSTHELIKYKVPAIVCPQGYDQFLIAERLAACRSGCVLRSGDVTPEKLRSYAEQILYSDCENVLGREKLAQSYVEARGIDKAVELIERFG